MRLIFIISFIGILSGFLIGYDTANIASILVFLNKTYDLSMLIQELIVTSILVGAFTGAILSSYFSNVWGRKKALMLACIVYLTSHLFLAFSNSILDILVWRTLLGFAVGISSMVAPLLIAETSSGKWRGAFVASIQLAITFGILISYIVGSMTAHQQNWHVVFNISLLPAGLLLFALFFTPESPRWLVKTGDDKKARNILQRMGEKEIDNRIKEIKFFSEKESHWRDLFSHSIRPVLILATGLFIFQNLSGIDAILYYAPKIFQLVGFKSDVSAILATTFLGSVNFLATIIALWLVDRVGRRPLLLCGLFVMTVSLAALSFCLQWQADFLVDEWIAVISLAIYIATFAISLGPLPYIIMSEVFPLTLRSQGMSVAAASAWGINILVSITFLSLIELIGRSGTFGLYGFVCLLAWIFCFVKVPETKGCTLEEIESNLNAGSPTRYLGVK